MGPDPRRLGHVATRGGGGRGGRSPILAGWPLWQATQTHLLGSPSQPGRDASLASAQAGPLAARVCHQRSWALLVEVVDQGRVWWESFGWRQAADFRPSLLVYLLPERGSSQPCSPWGSEWLMGSAATGVSWVNQA